MCKVTVMLLFLSKIGGDFGGQMSGIGGRYLILKNMRFILV